MDHEPIANSAVKSKLRKDRILSASGDVQAAIESELSSNLLVPAVPGSSTSKAESRLLSSKSLATEVHSVIDALRNVIQPKQKTAQEELGSEGEEEFDQEERPSKLGKSLEPVTAGDEESNGDEEADDGWESGAVDDPADDDWESGSVHGTDDTNGDEDTSERRGKQPDSEGSARESSDNEDDSDVSPSRLSSKSVKNAKRDAGDPLPVKDIKGKSKAAAVGQSTFLPSLSVGFTRGDSDASDFSDAESDKVERKNRRGQRARRAYGSFVALDTMRLTMLCLPGYGRRNTERTRTM